jgi:hypothetical protein
MPSMLKDAEVIRHGREAVARERAGCPERTVDRLLRLTTTAMRSSGMP